MNRFRNAPLRLLLTVALGGALLVTALLLAALLVSMRKPPAQTSPPEPVLAVEVVRMVPEDVPMVIVGYGDAASIEVSPIAPQVSGNVVPLFRDITFL